MFKAIADFFKNLFKSNQEEPERPNLNSPPPAEIEEPVVALATKSVKPAATKPAKLLWYPAAEQVAKMPARGKFSGGYPIGLIVHFNAGRNNSKGTIDYGRKQGYNYLAMGRDGTIYQPNPLNEWGYHAGTSSWTIGGKKVSGVSKYFIGIEIASAGRLDKLKTPEGDKKYVSWFGEKYTDKEVRYSAKKDNIIAGYYHAYTKEQEDSLVAFCLWLKKNNPDVFNFDYVLGHDEVAPGRKNDPGAALSMTMPEFRALLKKLYK